MLFGWGRKWNLIGAKRMEEQSGEDKEYRNSRWKKDRWTGGKIKKIGRTGKEKKKEENGSRESRRRAGRQSMGSEAMKSTGEGQKG